VLAAVRQQTVRHYATPQFISAWVNDVRLLPVTLLITAGLIGLAMLTRGPVESAMGWTEHHGFYAEFFPHWLLNTFFPFFTMLSFFLLVVGLVRFWGSMKAADALTGVERPTVGIVPSIISTVKGVLLHDRFGKCGAQAARKWAHLAAFYGFITLFIVTVWAVIDIYLLPMVGVDSLYPFDLLHPMKVLANVGGALLIYGSLKAIVDRRSSGSDVGTSTSFDWVFVWLLLGVGVTGFATQIFRFTVDPSAESVAVTAAYATYFIHLVLVFQLLVYLPYSKFAHIFYRTVAMVYAAHTGRNNGVGQLPSGDKAVIEAESAPEAITAGGD
jgi:quinone-modifying oxidoreductase subunit QmoC